MNADRHTGPADRTRATEETVELTIVARRAGVKIVHVRRYLEFGLFQPHPSAAADTPRFDPRSAARVARAERLRRTSGSTTPAPCSHASSSTGSRARGPPLSITLPRDGCGSGRSNGGSRRVRATVAARGPVCPREREPPAPRAGNRRGARSLPARPPARPARRARAATPGSGARRRGRAGRPATGVA